MFNHPARLIPLAFLVAALVGTALLSTPWARADSGQPAPLLTALFTSVSATCITGLTVVDTATYWTVFGQVVILVLVQIGGFGIMTLATLAAVLVTGRMGLRSSLTVQTESHTLNLGELRGVIATVVIMMMSLEALMAVVISARLRSAYDHTLGTAIWHGVFHAVSGFNNSGFTLYSDSLVGFSGDVTILAAMMFLIVAGGVGFPVFHEVSTHWRRPRDWSMHTRVTMIGYMGLLVLGVFGVALFEWGNPGTLGPMSLGDKVLNSFFGGITVRTAGFNTFDYALATHETWAMYDVLMFIGGGSAGTSGGLKVGTFVVLAYVLWSEIRGEHDVVIGRRSLPTDTMRQAITVALLAVGFVAAGSMVLMIVTDYSLDLVLFQVLSAFSTTGLSPGITHLLPPSAQVVIIGLMFVGRVGTVTVASALALRQRHRAYRLPEERPIIG
ncbi:MAG: potassium transporter TrkG [Thermoleophilia bacterium]